MIVWRPTKILAAWAGPLTGPTLGTYWRYRVGDYRLICSTDDVALRVLVIEVGNRRDVYR